MNYLICVLAAIGLLITGSTLIVGYILLGGRVIRRHLDNTWELSDGCMFFVIGHIVALLLISLVFIIANALCN